MAEDKASSDVDKACAYFFLAHYDFDGVKEQSEHAMTALAMSRYLMDQFPQDDLYSNMVTKLEFILQHVHGNGKEVEGSKGMETGTQDGDPSSRASEGVTSKPMQLQAGGELQDKVSVSMMSRMFMYTDIPQGKPEKEPPSRSYAPRSRQPHRFVPVFSQRR